MKPDEGQIPQHVIVLHRGQSFERIDFVKHAEADTSMEQSVPDNWASVGETYTSGSPTIREDSSTDRSIIPEVLERSIVELCNSADIDDFEYGYKSRFSTCLEEIVLNFSIDAIEAIQQSLFFEQLDDDVVIEILQTLGDIKNTPTHHARLLVLLKGLNSKSARIRCGAALGLADLGDTSAISYLRRAMEKETSPSSINCFLRVLEQLEDTQRQYQ